MLTLASKFQLVPFLLNLHKHHARQVKQDQAFFECLVAAKYVTLLGRRDR